MAGPAEKMLELRMHAAGFFYEEEGDVDILVIAERPDGEGRRLEIQRARKFTADDRELGWDTYCLVTDAGAAHYGGIERWALEDDLLTLFFDAKAAVDG